MKKALMLAGLVLCAAVGFAAENQTDLAVRGKKRNEDAYEKMLEQTGWKNQQASSHSKNDASDAHDHQAEPSRPKSS